MSWKQSLNFKLINIENDEKKARQMDDFFFKFCGPCNNTCLYKHLLFDSLDFQSTLTDMIGHVNGPLGAK